MQSSDFLAAIVYITFNVPILLILCVVPFGSRLNQALKQKSPNGDATESASYSRITGALGAVAVTSFFWSIGNVVLSHALAGDDKISPLIRAITPFFLIGSALFLPYAFNQLKTLVPGTGQLAAGGEIAAGAGHLTDFAPSSLRLMIANISSDITDLQLDKTLAAISKQISQHFEPEWKVGAVLRNKRLILDQTQASVDSAADAIVYLGDKAQDPYGGVEQVFGYHDRTHGATRIPYGFVYQDVCAAKGEAWSVALSHEILELLADPSAVERVTGPDPRVGFQGLSVDFEKEVCDPTQGDVYPIDGIKVVNFVTKAYFGQPGGVSRTNFLGLPLKPFGLRPGGYYQFIDDSGPQVLSLPQEAPAQEAARILMGPYRRNARRHARQNKRTSLG